MHRLLIVALMLSLTPVIGAQTRPPADALAKSVQQRYAGIRDFSAEFVHTYRGGALRKQATESGTVAVKKPGKMRWEYSAPEKKTFVSDGVKLYSYIPQDRQVIVSSVPQGDEATTAVMFLAGRGDVARDFTASYPQSREAGSSPPGTVALSLAPKRAEREYERLILFLDPVTLQIRALTTYDRQGGESTFTFGKMKENQGLADKDFAFRIPRGVDVITDGSVSR
jgi:outer membrane lipoprotein carrier protein